MFEESSDGSNPLDDVLRAEAATRARCSGGIEADMCAVVASAKRWIFLSRAGAGIGNESGVDWKTVAAVDGGIRAEISRDVRGQIMSACLKKEILLAFADGELPPGEMESAERHIAACAVCKQELESIRATRVKVNALLSSLAPDEA